MTFTTKGPLHPRELHGLMQSLLFLTVLAERHYAVELLVVITTGLTAKLMDFILQRSDIQGNNLCQQSKLCNKIKTNYQTTSNSTNTIEQRCKLK